MAPRGLKKALKETAPCRLIGSGYKRRFQVVDRTKCAEKRLRGLTKRLQTCVFSDGELPRHATASDTPAGGHWRGADGGRRRGAAVDSQVSRLAGMSAEKRFSSKMLNLTRNVFAALSTRGLEPVMGQRAVCAASMRIGTAADILCYDPTKSQLLVVELKCGSTGSRTAAAAINGNACKMKGPLHKAMDNVINRHMSQLAVTHHLLTNEKRTMLLLGNLGLNSLDGLLLYPNDSGVETYPLLDWWKARASALLVFMK